ncbi:MAG: hypothetical protein ACXWJW_08600 [Xanthobacteraceae bacterium]
MTANFRHKRRATHAAFFILREASAITTADVNKSCSAHRCEDVTALDKISRQNFLAPPRLTMEAATRWLPYQSAQKIFCRMKNLALMREGALRIAAKTATRVAIAPTQHL